MPKAVLICGKICAGKSTYAKQLSKERNAVILSSDELMLSLFDPMLGDRHDEFARKAADYLYALALRILAAGTEVILDWGFWTKEGRREAEAYFRDRSIEVEWHYVHASDELWQRNIKRRNQAVLNGESQAYFVDEGLLNKLNIRFEQPDRGEIDVFKECSSEHAKRMNKQIANSPQFW